MKADTHLTTRVFGFILLIVMSVLAGVLGGFLSQDLIDIQDIARYTRDQPYSIVLEDRTKNSDDPELIAKEYAGSIVTLYQMPHKDRQSEYLLDSWKVGTGVVVTTDGWLMVLREFPGALLADVRIVDSQHRVSLVSSQIADPATGIVFLKVASSGWKPVELASDVSALGQRKGYIISALGGFKEIGLTAPRYPDQKTSEDLVQSSDRLSKLLNASDVFDWQGLPVFLNAREMVGMTRDRGIVPSSYLRDALNRLLQSQKIVRPTLGIPFRDLAWTLSLQRGQSRGAQVAGSVAVRLKTKEGDERLQPGDTIARVNEEVIDGNRSLSELIQQYQRGDTLKLTILSKGKERIVNIILP